jgi:hypothetical protein
MPVDHIRYDLLTQKALRSVVRRVLTDAAKSGLPGEHHFYVTFDTRAPGVRLSARLREQYPEAMTIVLQHQFYDLTVTDAAFDVGLSFNGIVERLHIPLEAITGFVDPSVQFGLQFETLPEGAEEAPPAPERPAAAPAAEPRSSKVRKPAAEKLAAAPEKSAPQAVPATAPAAARAKDDGGDKPTGGGAEVVRLDRFRKK